jgi:hypothetical protein
VSDTQLKVVVAKLVLAALDLVDAKLTDEQRLKAEQIYELANSLESELEGETCTEGVQIVEEDE